MRTLVRPVLLFAFLCGFTAISQSQPDSKEVINIIAWTANFPMPTVGGVDVSVDITPAKGWTCTDITLRVIDDSTNKTLGEYNKENPGAVVSKSFGGMENLMKVRVTADAVFQSGGEFDPKQIQTTVVTK